MTDNNKLNKRWFDQYEELRRFKEKEGHCCVPRRYKENPKLSSWVCNQREANKKKKLSNERKKMLNHIGFCWIPSAKRGTRRDDIQWNKMLGELKEFKLKNNWSKNIIT